MPWERCRSVIHCRDKRGVRKDPPGASGGKDRFQLTDPGLGSGTFPVYSLHLESCTSMYGPSNTLCTSEKAYWQIADALIFFLKTDP